MPDMSAEERRVEYGGLAEHLRDLVATIQDGEELPPNSTFWIGTAADLLDRLEGERVASGWTHDYELEAWEDDKPYAHIVVSSNWWERPDNAVPVTVRPRPDQGEGG